jgi:hypothetical protein
MSLAIEDPLPPAAANPLPPAAAVFGALEQHWGWLVRFGLATRAATPSRHGDASAAA